MFRRVSDWLALTSTERKVILFLSGTVLVGAGIRLYQETFPSVPQFDYSASDSTFAALSEKETEGATEQKSFVAETNAEESTAEDDTATSKVNINVATKLELMTLPGIGEVTSDRIIAYRTDVALFRSIDELRKVKGISKRKLEQLTPFITIE
jgi:competence ComEA-like helix-hairpin-helix protein